MPQSQPPRPQLRRRALLGGLGLLLALAAGIGAHRTSAQAPSQAPALGAATARAIFAGGCFWCMVHPFDQLKGVSKVVSGYTAGKTANPTYEQVSSGGTGHTEAVEITYNPAEVSYERLLEVFWHNIDPVTPDAQFCDHGTQYRSGIYYLDEAQKKAAEASKASLAPLFKQPIATEIVKATAFFAAEDYHQDYYKKNPVRYNYYRLACGRDARLKSLWGDKAAH